MVKSILISILEKDCLKCNRYIEIEVRGMSGHWIRKSVYKCEYCIIKRLSCLTMKQLIYLIKIRINK